MKTTTKMAVAKKLAMHCRLTQPDVIAFASALITMTRVNKAIKFQHNQALRSRVITFYCKYITRRCDLDL